MLYVRVSACMCVYVCLYIRMCEGLICRLSHLIRLQQGRGTLSIAIILICRYLRARYGALLRGVFFSLSFFFFLRTIVTLAFLTLRDRERLLSLYDPKCRNEPQGSRRQRGIDKRGRKTSNASSEFAVVEQRSPPLDH